MTCHQSNAAIKPLGPTLLNLNGEVERDEIPLNQLTHLQNLGVLNDFSVQDI